MPKPKSTTDATPAGVKLLGVIDDLLGLHHNVEEMLAAEEDESDELTKEEK
jgi:hypothetical protein